MRNVEKFIVNKIVYLIYLKMDKKKNIFEQFGALHTPHDKILHLNN